MKNKGMLHRLLELARLEQRDMQVFFDSAERQLMRSRDTERILEDYQTEQLAKNGKQLGLIISSQQFFGMRNFSDKLEAAMLQQRAKVAIDESSLAHARTRLTAATVRLRSIEKLQNRRNQRLHERELKREQQQTDEIASIKSHSQSTNQCSESESSNA